MSLQLALFVYNRVIALLFCTIEIFIFVVNIVTKRLFLTCISRKNPQGSFVNVLLPSLLPKEILDGVR